MRCCRTRSCSIRSCSGRCCGGHAGRRADGRLPGHPAWRELARDAVVSLARTRPGAVVVPMTLVDDRYFEEIVGGIGERCARPARLARGAGGGRRRAAPRPLRRGLGLDRVARCVEALGDERFARISMRRAPTRASSPADPALVGEPSFRADVTMGADARVTSTSICRSARTAAATATSSPSSGAADQHGAYVDALLLELERERGVARRSGRDRLRRRRDADVHRAGRAAPRARGAAAGGRGDRRGEPGDRDARSSPRSCATAA